MSPRQDIQTSREILRDIQAKQDRLLNALYGDKEAGVEGIAEKVKGIDMYVTALKEEGTIQKLQEHAKYIQTDKRFKWLAAGGLFGVNGGFLAYLKSHLGL